ncbi:MAG: hypothetical protein ACRDGG_05780 [Anaerolineae bacterium]
MTPAQLFNQNSFLIGVVALLGGSLIALIARRAGVLAWSIWGIALVLAVGVYFALRTAPPRVFASAADVQRAVSAGTPTLVEFYSDF